MKQKLSALAPETRSVLSQALQQRVLEQGFWRRASSVALFVSRPDEPDTTLLLAAGWKEGKRILLPRVRGEHLDFFAVAGQKNLVKGSFGLWEPDETRCTRVEPRELGLLLVPGLAYDRAGHRLGRGRGFYDRWLTGRHTELCTVGLFFSLQEVPEVPAEAHDQKLDLLLTEEAAIMKS